MRTLIIVAIVGVATYLIYRAVMEKISGFKPNLDVGQALKNIIANGLDAADKAWRTWFVFETSGGVATGEILSGQGPAGAFVNIHRENPAKMTIGGAPIF